MANLVPNKDDLRIHFCYLFRHASAGVYVAHRAYTEGKPSQCISITATCVGQGDLVEDAMGAATSAANYAAPAVYCPPIAGFSTAKSAAEASLVEAYTLTVDCDQHPSESRKQLESCLGPATVVVATGGEWLDPDTGEVEEKCHLHWRLIKPATGAALVELKAVRRLAAEKVGGDMTGASPVHCFRAPGSWHRKGAPKLARIISNGPEIEIGLDDARERLEEMPLAPWVTPKTGSSTKTGQGVGNDKDLDDIYEGIQSGRSYHNGLVSLSARWTGAGMHPGAVETNLRALMDASIGPRDARWHDRYEDIPRIVESAADKFGERWPDPQPLPNVLPPVMAFDPAMLPQPLRPWAMDIADRMQCPPDYVAVSTMVAAGSVIGRRVGIRAQENTDWTEVPNLWGMIVGRPGVMKSPATSHALKPMRRLDANAADRNAEAKRFHEVALADHKPGDGPKPSPPAYQRYIVNDTSYEALGVVMADNPNGVMVYRDELVSLLKPLGRDDHAAARGFFLTAWNGNEGYTFDRIMRGHVHIEACCLSLLGATQPGKLALYLQDAMQGGAGDDGFAQRFGLLVWPDVAPNWKDIDREPDGEARRTANFVFDRLDALDPAKIGAQKDDFDPIPYLRFAPDALEAFRLWRGGLESRLRRGELHDAMVSHLNKYRGLIPKIALIVHLAEGAIGPVSLKALQSALLWAEYLETHAERAYACVTSAKMSGAGLLLGKVRGGYLPSPFTARDVYGKGWSGLGDSKLVAEALQILVEYEWLREAVLRTGGHPKTTYTINPKAQLT